MRTRRHPAALAGTLACLAALGACTPAPPGDPPAAPAVDVAAERAAVDSVLGALHAAAAAGDFATYFGLFRPDAVFFGTDATERWGLDAFRAYAEGSRGWTYTMTERHVFLGSGGQTAWFDERLRNAAYGETRGTGVLVRTDGGWKLAQYNLSIPIPNDLAREFTGRIMAHEGGQ